MEQTARTGRDSSLPANTATAQRARERAGRPRGESTGRGVDQVDRVACRCASGAGGGADWMVCALLPLRGVHLGVPVDLAHLGSCRCNRGALGDGGLPASMWAAMTRVRIWDGRDIKKFLACVRLRFSAHSASSSNTKPRRFRYSAQSRGGDCRLVQQLFGSAPRSWFHPVVPPIRFSDPDSGSFELRMSSYELVGKTAVKQDGRRFCVIATNTDHAGLGQHSHSALDIQFTPVRTVQ